MQEQWKSAITMLRRLAVSEREPTSLLELQERIAILTELGELDFLFEWARKRQDFKELAAVGARRQILEQELANRAWSNQAF